MIVQYENEYEEVLFSVTTESVPLVGDSVVIDGNEFVVKSRTFYLKENGVSVVLSDYVHNSTVAESKDNTRLNQLNAAIIETTARVKDNEKKTRFIGDQISSVKKHINQQTRQNKKETDDKPR